MTRKKHVRIAESILSETREELARADNKAALTLAAIGIVIGALLAAFVAGQWTPRNLAMCVEWLWWLGAAAGATGVAFLVAAVYPSTRYRRKRDPDIVAYFGDVVGAPREALRKRLTATAKKSDSRVIDQLVIVSSIVDRKYKKIQGGLWSIAFCGALCTTAVLVTYILKIA